MDNRTQVVKNCTFSKFDTNLCKGIAILFMVLHHSNRLYYNNFDLAWYSNNSKNALDFFVLLFSTAGKVCVPILTILSGYGLSIAYSKTKQTERLRNCRFICSRVFSFYSLYWPIFFVILLRYANTPEKFLNYYIYVKEPIKAIILFVMDFFAVTPFFGFRCTGSWYAFAIIVFYVLFPLLHKIMEKCGLLFLIVSFIPWVVKIFVFYLKGREIDSDSPLFYIFAFCIGIFFATNNVLSNYKQKTGWKYVIISTVLLIITFCLRIVFALIVDTFFGIAVILFCVSCLSKSTFLFKAIGFLGKHSANIWLTHGLFFFQSIPILLRFTVSFVCALVFSILLEYLKKSTRYSEFVSKTKSRIIS